MLFSFANRPIQQMWSVYQGEWYYLAPELQNTGGRYGYDREQEIWALGMLLLEMLTHYKPPGNRKEQTIDHGDEEHYKIVGSFSEKAQNLLDIMLCKNPK